MKQMKDVAIIGGAGAGKTTGAIWCEELAGYTRYSFATAVKDVAEMLWGPEARSNREILQKLGTEVARQIDPDVWCNKLMEELDIESHPVVIDDCRFPNEYWALKSRGFIFIRVIAPPEKRLDRLHVMGKDTTPEHLKHESETALADYKADYELQNDADSKEQYLSDLATVLKGLVR